MLWTKFAQHQWRGLVAVICVTAWPKPFHVCPHAFSSCVGIKLDAASGGRAECELAACHAAVHPLGLQTQSQSVVVPTENRSSQIKLSF